MYSLDHINILRKLLFIYKIAVLIIIFKKKQPNPIDGFFKLSPLYSTPPLGDIIVPSAIKVVNVDKHVETLHTLRSLRFLKENVCLFPNLNKRHNGSTLYKSVCLY